MHFSEQSDRINSLVLSFPFCSGTFSVPLDDDSGAQKDTLSPLASLPLLKKMGKPTHVPKYYHKPHVQRSVWAEAAPSSPPVRVQQSLPQDAEGIVGPVI